MTTPDATRDAGPVPAEPIGAAPVSVPPSPTQTSGWLLRAAAIGAATAGLLCLIVAPGARGNAGELVVVGTEIAGDAASYFAAAVLVALLLRGALELSRSSTVPAPPRVALMAGAAAAVGLAGSNVVGLGHERLPPPIAVLLAGTASVTALAAAWTSVRTPHTRALAGVLFALAVAAITRLGAWELAIRAGDTANLPLFRASQALAKAGVLLETAAQVLAVTWLTARGRTSGQLASFAAGAVAYAITWGVADGARPGAPAWEVIVRAALVDSTGVPPPGGLEALSTFLVPGSLLFALVAALQPGPAAAVAAATALALVSRGAFDAPLRALCSVAAAQWAVIAFADERAMWRALVADRDRRRSEERG
jgi:hypothetical protein